MDAENIRIETDEDGFWLEVKPEGAAEYRFRITDPEALYDHVKAAIGPWLYERDMARSERANAALAGVRTFACDPDESGGYAADDPKHPDFHSVHADLYDRREGK